MTTPMIPANFERFLQITAQREQVVSANMANVDTPGYHAKDVSFAETLLRAGDSEAPVRIQDERGLLERPDGNNVDLDHEGLLLAKAQLQYGMGVQLVKGEFHEIMSAINGGN